DPIGAEVDRLGFYRVGEPLPISPPVPAEFDRAYALASSGKTDSLNGVVYFQSDSMYALALAWREASPGYRREWERSLESIHDALGEARFRTTKALLAHRVRHHAAVMEMAAVLDDFSAQPRADLHVRLLEHSALVAVAEADQLKYV